MYKPYYASPMFDTLYSVDNKDTIRFERFRKITLFKNIPQTHKSKNADQPLTTNVHSKWHYRDFDVCPCIYYNNDMFV